MCSNKKKKLRVLQMGNPMSMFGAERWIMALIKLLDPDKIKSWVALKDEIHLKPPFCN